ncbi:MAG: RecQ family ATP-dependent DNA helicase [Sphaerochaetaceae bacterium]|nr:RecQ family ATP-dependent DNA helicase [Sphaerochaetaceae bacterium]
MMKDEQSQTDRQIENILQKRFHLDSLYPFQQLVIRDILEQEGLYGEEYVRKGPAGTVVILPTGSGKSVCFTLPAMIIKSVTVIIYPLLSLLGDQMRRMKELGEHPAVLKGGQTEQEREYQFSSIIRGDTHIILTTPEMLEDKRILERLGQLTISLIVVDEAHVIAQWGLTFRPSYIRLRESLQQLRCNHILAFTATSDDRITSVINSILLPHGQMNIIRGNTDRENIYYQVCVTLSKMNTLYNIVKNPRMRPAIVFFRSRKGCEQTAVDLIFRLRMPIVRPYHAKLDRAEREATEKWFFDHPDAVLCATSAYGMGVDKKDIRSVIHWDLSEDAPAFLQESGRGGRDGRQFYSFTLITPLSHDHTTPLQSVFYDSSRCRRERLMELMGTPIEACSGCDVCNGTFYPKPAGQHEILRAVKSRPLHFTVSTLAHHLGGTSYRPVDTRLPFYSVFSSWTYEEIYEAVETLIRCGMLSRFRRGLLLYNYPLLTKMMKRFPVILKNTTDVNRIYDGCTIENDSSSTLISKKK